MEIKMDKKAYLIIGIVGLILLLGIGTGIYFVFFKDKNPVVTTDTASSSTAVPTNPAQEQGQPIRTAELKGIVKSIEGNDIVIVNELSEEKELTDEEKAIQKAERAKLSIEERQAIKAEESATVLTEDVRIIVPVGVAIKKTVGDATGTLVDGGLNEIKEGTYISIWVNGYGTADQFVEFVKIRGTL
jgi:hypothetical protein